MADLKRVFNRYMTKKTCDFTNSLVTVVRALRRRQGIKQSVIASALSMTGCNYSKIESNSNGFTVQQLVKISEALGTDVRKIVFLAHALNDINVHNGHVEEHVVRLMEDYQYDLMDDFREVGLVNLLMEIRNSNTASL
jgi:transcriptional regulator with XRE-family HTH domain